MQSSHTNIPVIHMQFRDKDKFAWCLSGSSGWEPERTITGLLSWLTLTPAVSFPARLNKQMLCRGADTGFTSKTRKNSHNCTTLETWDSPTSLKLRKTRTIEQLSQRLLLLILRRLIRFKHWNEIFTPADNALWEITHRWQLRRCCCKCFYTKE